MTRLAEKALGLAVILLLLPPAGAEVISDRRLIEKFIRLGFPGATVRLSSGTSFEVVRQPDEHERHFAGDVTGQQPESHRRIVEVKVISSRIRGSREPLYVALFSYGFPDIPTCGACHRLVKVALIYRNKGQWRTDCAYLEATNPAVDTAYFVDVNGDGIAELLIHAGGGVNAWTETTLHVFDVAGRALHSLGDYSTAYDSTNSGFEKWKYEKKLDLEKTRKTRGTHLIFHVTTFARKNTVLATPEVSEETVPIKPTAK